jgi:NAD(P)H dehydrogenase (quinone)
LQAQRGHHIRYPGSQGWWIADANHCRYSNANAWRLSNAIACRLYVANRWRYSCEYSQHIVYTSLPAPQPSETSPIEDDHFWTEQAIAASSMSWTFMRHGLYADNLLWSLPQAVTSGVLATATANRGRHWVTRADCARADAAALASDDTSRRIHEITGPAAVTAEELAAMVTQLTGKLVKHVNVTPAALHDGMASAGLPPAIVGASVGFDLATARGFHSTVTPSVEELTGRTPTSLKDFLASQKARLQAMSQ